MQEDLSVWVRIWLGGFGGLIAVICKGIFQELPFVMRLIDTDQQGKVMSEIYGFSVLGIGLIILGAAASWYFDEKSRRACFAMGLAGPALIGTIAGGNFSDVSRPPPTRGGWNLEYILPVSSANAAELLTKPSSQKGSLWEGLKLVVGVGKDQGRYYVIAGPYSSDIEASSVGKKIMKEHSDLPVFVVPIANLMAITGHPPAMLAIGNSLPYSSARSLRDRVKDFPELKDVKELRLASSGEIEPPIDQRLAPH